MPDEKVSQRTFRNPVYGQPFADPMVLKFNGAYYAYGTPPHGGGLPVLRSSDLVDWQVAGEALGQPEAGRAHWAPEVAYDNGRFFLYHSTGGYEGEDQRLRVATGASPTGPFDEDLGLLDPDDPFTIDAHPFRDDDGTWYLFYSRDFIDGDPVGTGIVVDRLVDMTGLLGQPETVMRPHAEWHLYERQRHWYDRVWDWYTVEGPFVRKHDGRYWCFYSGGAWKAANYGISSAVADSPMGPYEPVLAEDTADVLRTIGEKVIGPGHGSVAIAPDNVTEYLVYHAWDREQTGRFMHIDRLLWDDGRPQSPGPRVDDQRRPPEPLFRDLFDATCGRPSAAWRFDGEWEATSAGLAHGDAEGLATAVVDIETPSSYLLEVNVAMSDGGPAGGRAGATVALDDAHGATIVVLDPKHGELGWERIRHGEVEACGTLGRLRHDFAPSAFHQLVIDRGRGGACVVLDGVSMGTVPDDVLTGGRPGVCARNAAVTVAGVTVSDTAR